LDYPRLMKGAAMKSDQVRRRDNASL